MSSNPFSVSLAELEDNLKNIDSTQKQVKNLVTTIDSLTKSYQEVLTKVESASNDISREKKNNKESFNTAVKLFSSDLSAFENNLADTFGRVSQSSDLLIKSQTDLLETNKTSWTKHNKELKVNIEQFKRDLDSESKEIVASTIDKFDSLSKIFSDQILLFSTTIEEKIEELNNIRTTRVLGEVQQKVDDIEAELLLLKEQARSNHDFLQLIQKSNNDQLKELNAVINKKTTLNSIIICVGFVVVLLAVYVLK